MKYLMPTAALLLATSSVGVLANDSVATAVGDSKNWAIQTGDYANHRYSELDQINKSNVKDLQVAWTFSTGVPWNVRWRAPSRKPTGISASEP